MSIQRKGMGEPNGLAETVSRVSLEPRTLIVDWADGHRSSFHYIWLRDNCPCPACRHPNGQRLLETVSIQPEIHAGSAQVTAEGTIEIIWDRYTHVSRWSSAWLRRHCYCLRERARRKPLRRYWDAETMASLPEASYGDVSSSHEALVTWLEMIALHGFAFLRGVPVASGSVTHVAELFSHVWETNYGRHFDVKQKVDPINVAYTSIPLSPHTDNPYRDPIPSLQLLHCLLSSDMGGDTTLVDGFRVAESLRDQEPDMFRLLATIPIAFRYHDRDTDLAAEATVIGVSPSGELVAVRFNNATAGSFDIDSDLMTPYYDAYKTFAGLLESPKFQISFKLEPGDLYIVDNLRVLHGRTEFSSGGTRHLQGCYADRDGLFSVLRRRDSSMKEDRSISRQDPEGALCRHSTGGDYPSSGAEVPGCQASKGSNLTGS